MKKYMNRLPDTGERLVFKNPNEITIEHLHRYAFAQGFVAGKNVLDIACGEGYGSNYLAKMANRVIGIDLDEQTVKWASSKYSRSNLEYICAPIESMPLKESTIDIIVSFETIEHVVDSDKMILELKRVLKDDGVLLISTPDKKHYSDDRNYKNPFHTKEFYLDEFKNFMESHFNQNSFYLQKTVNYTSIIEKERDFSQIKFYDGIDTNIEIVDSKHKIIIAVASDSIFDKSSGSIFTGSLIRDFIEKSKMNKISSDIKNSISFKVGKFLCLPFFKIKRLIKNKLFVGSGSR